MTSWHGIPFHITGPLCGESNSGFPAQRASDAELSFLVEVFEQTVKRPTKWDTLILMWHHFHEQQRKFCFFTPTFISWHNHPNNPHALYRANTFFLKIQIQWKINFPVILILAKISPQILHMTRQHRCRVMCKTLWRSVHYNLDESKMKFPSQLYRDGKIVSEMASRTRVPNHIMTAPVNPTSAHFSWPFPLVLYIHTYS